MKMDEISLTRLFSVDLEERFCLEIDFEVMGDRDHTHCWMGKTPDENDTKKDVYWFGLAADGSQGYQYDRFEELYQAPVFHGKSLKDILPGVSILSIDGLSPEERLAFYLEN